MKRLAFLLLFGILFLAADCNDDNPQPNETGILELNFKGTFGNDPLVMYAREYAYEAGMKLKLQLFRFYLAEITLADNYKISDVEIVDFEDVQSDGMAQQGITIRLEKVPANNYNGIKMGIGLNEKLNKTQPGDYEPGHPLSDNYWSWALGYVFTKIEGNADINGDGVFNDKLTFHIGANSLYRNKQFNKSFTVKAGETTRLNFEVDLRKVLVKNESNFLDFRKVTIDHTNNMEVATFISDNLVNAIEMK
ncbi:MAG: MbnP family protein [Saprospiraceae bacterium]